VNLLIENKTSFSGRGLRSLFLKTMSHFAEGKTSYGVLFGYTKFPRGRTGFGYYNTNRMAVLLDKNWESQSELTPGQKVRLVNTILHEVEHNEGARHKDMDCGAYTTGFNLEDILWVKDIKIERKAESTKISPSQRAGRKEAHAKVMLAKHEAKLKREQKLIRKWKVKVKYYEKKKAASTDTDS